MTSSVIRNERTHEQRREGVAYQYYVDPAVRRARFWCFLVCLLLILSTPLSRSLFVSDCVESTLDVWVLPSLCDSFRELHDRRRQVFRNFEPIITMLFSFLANLAFQPYGRTYY